MKFINELREGENIREIYLCKQFQTLQSKLGKNYYALQLQDKTGLLDGKVWDINNAIEHFEVLDFILVEGRVVLFQEKPQLNITRIRRVHEGEYDPANYMPSSERDIEEMYKELCGFISSVKEPHLKSLLESFFINDKELVKTFKFHSAARSVHHGFVGGLLEHTLSVTSVCNAFAKQYPILNRDLLLTAAMCHDIAKVRELSDFPENDYTDEGNLIGHLVMGSEMVSERAAKIPGFPKVLENELKHCILAHHGKFEYGSPKLPALAEAMALHFADNLDAKLETMKELFSGVDDKVEWLGFQRSFETNVRRTTEQ